MRKPCPLYVLYGTLARSKRNTHPLKNRPAVPSPPRPIPPTLSVIHPVPCATAPPRGPALDEALRRDLRWRGTGIIVEWEHVIS